MSDLNIYQRINKIMSKGLYLKKGSAGQGTGVQYDELIALLSPFLAEFGIVITSEKFGESRKRDTAKGTYIFECDYAITYINIDNPEDRFTNTVESHAMDAGDKAPGKAITYAAKISILKVFAIESGDNEESRSEQNDTETITEEQGQILYNLLVDDGTQLLNSKGMKISRALKFNHITELKASKFDEAMEMAK